MLAVVDEEFECKLDAYCSEIATVLFCEMFIEACSDWSYVAECYKHTKRCLILLKIYLVYLQRYLINYIRYYMYFCILLIY